MASNDELWQAAKRRRIVSNGEQLWQAALAGDEWLTRGLTARGLDGLNWQNPNGARACPRNRLPGS